MTLMFLWKSPSLKKCGWTFSHGPLPDNPALDDRRAEFDRFESTLSKVESDLGFDKGMAAMRPEDVLRSTAHIAEDSTGYLSSDTGGRVFFTQILSQLNDRSREF